MVWICNLASVISQVLLWHSSKGIYIIDRKYSDMLERA